MSVHQLRRPDDYEARLAAQARTHAAEEKRRVRQEAKDKAWAEYIRPQQKAAGASPSTANVHCITRGITC